MTQDAVLARIRAGAPLAEDDALALADLPAESLAPLLDLAAATRDAAWGRTITFSPKVFLPLTNVCRNHCDYCSFRRSPGEDGAWTMSRSEVEHWLSRGQREGCVEALFCLGDKPERAFAAHRRTLAALGHESTVAQLHDAGERALALGLLPHTNAGLLDASDMLRLRSVNASLGLMLECISPRLCEPGMPHHRAPDKRPEKRVAMIDEAGRLKIPFTTGILVGIGETRRERVESLLAIRALHARHGHVQEVIVQNFRTRKEIPMRDKPDPDALEIAHAIAMARLILPTDVSLQAPPNLNPAAVPLLIAAGVNDLGGISPTTPDYINPHHAWPHLLGLSRELAEIGFGLAPRLPVYDRYADDPEWMDPGLAPHVKAAREKLSYLPWRSSPAEV